jgi:hypothetical protein
MSPSTGFLLRVWCVCMCVCVHVCYSPHPTLNSSPPCFCLLSAGIMGMNHYTWPKPVLNSRSFLPNCCLTSGNPTATSALASTYFSGTFWFSSSGHSSLSHWRRISSSQNLICGFAPFCLLLFRFNKKSGSSQPAHLLSRNICNQRIPCLFHPPQVHR